MGQMCISGSLGRLAGAATIATALLLSAQDAHSSPFTDPISMAQALVRAAFGRLEGQFEASIVLHSELNRDWIRTPLIAITLWPVGEPGQRDQNGDHQFLGGLVSVTPDRYLERATFSGRLLHSSELSSLERAMASNPGSGLRELRAELTRLGAKYGPDERDLFLRDVDLGRFEDPLGKIVRSRAEFQWSIDLADRREVVSPSWLINIEAQMDGQTFCYYLKFEPITGYLRTAATLSCAAN